VYLCVCVFVRYLYMSLGSNTGLSSPPVGKREIERGREREGAANAPVPSYPILTALSYPTVLSCAAMSFPVISHPILSCLLVSYTFIFLYDYLPLSASIVSLLTLPSEFHTAFSFTSAVISGYLRLDLQTGEKQEWLAPMHTYCEEVVVVQKKKNKTERKEKETESDVWSVCWNL
jgi:hypothetical protein